MKIEKDKKMSLLNDNVFFAAVYVAGMAMGIAICQLVQYFAWELKFTVAKTESIPYNSTM